MRDFHTGHVSESFKRRKKEYWKRDETRHILPEMDIAATATAKV